MDDFELIVAPVKQIKVKLELVSGEQNFFPALRKYILWNEYSDHTWNDGEVVTPATYETKGEKKYTCTECGETKTEEIPVLEKPVTPEEPINPEKPDASETPDDQEKNPQTGDTLTFALVLFALAAVGVICVITLAKKKNIKAFPWG